MKLVLKLDLMPHYFITISCFHTMTNSLKYKMKFEVDTKVPY